jgi:hypothetical protein
VAPSRKKSYRNAGILASVEPDLTEITTPP